MLCLLCNPIMYLFMSIFLDQNELNTLLTWNGERMCISVINLSTVLSVEMIT